MNDEKKLEGLKKHSQEANKVVIESLQDAMLILIASQKFDKIKISDLCRKAGVSRMAFYGNFSSKDEILKTIVYKMNAELQKKVGSPFRKNTTREWYVNFFTFVKEKANIMTLIFETGFHKQYLELLNEIVLHDPTFPSDIKYQRLLWSGAIENVVSYWMETGMKESVDELATYCHENLISWSR